MKATANLKYAAEVRDVKEWSLRGSLDPGPWEEALAAIGLLPLRKEGRAELTIAVTDLVWKGFRFNEVNFVLPTVSQASGQEMGVWFPLAFNTRAFFAFSERLFFKTPYQHGQVTLAPDLSNWSLSAKGAPLLQAERHLPAAPAPAADHRWEGPAFVPEKRGPAKGRFFHVILQGATETYPFNPEKDQFEISPHPKFPVLQKIKASDFHPHTWEIRRAAFHAKSRTYPFAKLSEIYS